MNTFVTSQLLRANQLMVRFVNWAEDNPAKIQQVQATLELWQNRSMLILIVVYWFVSLAAFGVYIYTNYVRQ